MTRTASTLLAFSVALLAACEGGNRSAGAPDAAETPETSAAGSPGAPAEAVLETEAELPTGMPVSGTRCFAYADDTLTLEVELTFDGDGGLTGRRAGLIQDPSESYYSSYESAISGTLDGDSLTLRIETEIEDDTEIERAVWTWTRDSLHDGARDLGAVPCGPADGGAPARPGT